MDEAYRAWLALGQNYELDRFAVTRVAFNAGLDAAQQRYDELFAAYTEACVELAQLKAKFDAAQVF